MLDEPYTHHNQAIVCIDTHLANMEQYLSCLRQDKYCSMLADV